MQYLVAIVLLVVLAVDGLSGVIGRRINSKNHQPDWLEDAPPVQNKHSAT
jgi:hypothetical protein